MPMEAVMLLASGILDVPQKIFTDLALLKKRKPPPWWLPCHGNVTSAPPHASTKERKLEFLKPFKATNTTEFTFKPDGGETVVTWSMSGQCNFMAKAFGLFMNCDKMVGGDFEKGLAGMKSLAEEATKTAQVESRLACSEPR
jgi:hypothetical protein